jgi:hypothetical protein
MCLARSARVFVQASAPVPFPPDGTVHRLQKFQAQHLSRRSKALNARHEINATYRWPIPGTLRVPLAFRASIFGHCFQTTGVSSPASLGLDESEGSAMWAAHFTLDVREWERLLVDEWAWEKLESPQPPADTSVLLGHPWFRDGSRCGRCSGELDLGTASQLAEAVAGVPHGREFDRPALTICAPCLAQEELMPALLSTLLDTDLGRATPRVLLSMVRDYCRRPWRYLPVGVPRPVTSHLGEWVGFMRGDGPMHWFINCSPHHRLYGCVLGWCGGGPLELWDDIDELERAMDLGTLPRSCVVAKADAIDTAAPV